MSVQRRSGRFFAYVVTAFAVLSSIGCHGPQIVDEYDRVADTRTLTLGPVDLEGVFFGEVHFTATIPDYVLEHKPADQVTAVFRYIDFQTLSMRADRRVIKAHRRLFADAAVTFTGEEFAAIATAGHLVGTLDGGSFDGETTDFTFSPGVRQQLRLFAEKALLVKPKRPRELEIPSPEVRLNTPARVERGSIQSPAAVSRIRDIQGRAHRSPMTGTDVAGVEGIVTRVERRGFYLQDPKSDGDPSTSEALFVFTRSAPAVRVGDEVVVDGRVTEFVPGGRSTGNLSTTQISSSAVRVSQRDQALPAAVVLGAAGRSPPRESVCDDAIDGDVEAAGGKFDPGADAIDFFESLEGMRVSIASATAIGPTTRYGEIWVRIEDSGRSEGEVRTSRDGLLRGPGAVNPDRVRVRFHRGSTRSLGVGARLERLVGVLGYSFGNFELLLEERASKSLIVRESALREESSATKTGPGVLTIATYNVWNLSAKNTSRMTRIANHIATNLDAPDIVALQEVQDDNGPENDTVVSAKKTLGDLVRAISKAGGPEYAIRQLDPADDATAVSLAGISAWRISIARHGWSSSTRAARMGDSPAPRASVSARSSSRIRGSRSTVSFASEARRSTSSTAT